MVQKIKGNLPPINLQEAKNLIDLIDKKAVEFSGDLGDLEQAIGMYLLGRHVGWKVLILIHNKRTIKKYEDILGINIREAFPEIGPDAERSNAYRAAMTVSNFWKVVSGDIKIENRKEIS